MPGCNTTISNNNKRSVSFEVTLNSAKDFGCSEIMENFLFLGAGRDAQNMKLLKQLGITHVLCLVNGWSPKVDWNEMSINFLHLPILDKAAARIITLFPKAIDFIESAKQSPESRVLVHCAAGISRSSTVVIAYLMNSHNMTLKAAYEHVYLRRNSIRPNPGFFNQLIAFEMQLYSLQTMFPKDLSLLARLRSTSSNNVSKVMTPAEGMTWAQTIVTEDLLQKLFLEVCGGIYVPEKTADFLDKVMAKVRASPAVLEMQQNGYKWPKLSLNVTKTASYWYKAQRPAVTGGDESSVVSNDVSNGVAKSLGKFSIN